MSSNAEAVITGLGRRLEELAPHYRVPGAVLGILHNGAETVFATGVVNVATGVETTPEAVFQIGSNTKLFTATLVMQLVDEGKLDLDTPVQRYLPEFTTASHELEGEVTLRHLLTHTSGIDGDFFLDTGRGDDCLERYLIACSVLPQYFKPGTHHSYCNAGFSIAGRVIERATGMTWDRALRERLLLPVGAITMGTLPEEAIVHRAAAGHVMGPDGLARVAPIWALPRSNAPAGATPFARASDVLRFAQMHMDGGTATNGERVLSGASVAAMQAPQHRFDRPGDPAAWGLGWMLFNWDGHRVIGHDGGTLGQFSAVRVAPDDGVAVVLLTNGGNMPALARKLVGEAFEGLTGFTMPPLPEPPGGVEVDRAAYVGHYQKLSAAVEVREEAETLTATVHQRRSLIPGTPDESYSLEPFDDRYFLASPKSGGAKQVWSFVDFDAAGRPAGVIAGRYFRRVG
ncbi:MAG: beta-lactamase family protein [Chloroflexi bacterium]|nr:beta-lactamase family protein [Chloroflexota bacterium]